MQIVRQVGKYKYALLILLVGVGLMVMPQNAPETEAAEPEEQETTEQLEQQIESILSLMEGAGEVQVLLTMAEGPSHEYQTDLQTVTDLEGSEIQKQTVLISGENGQEAPIPIRSRYPIYQGALILSEGADSSVVRLQIVNAVSDLTGLGSDRISVIKMKDN